jgi:hypothetical protein
MELVQGQSFRANISLGRDITGYTAIKFYYKKPNGYILAVDGVSVFDETGIIYCDITSDQNDTPGVWAIWVVVDLLGGENIITFADAVTITPGGDI